MHNIATMKDVATDRVVPVWKSLERSARSAGRTAERGREVVQHFVTESGDRVRRHPFIAVAVTGLVCAGAGCAVGLLRGRRSKEGVPT